MRACKSFPTRSHISFLNLELSSGETNDFISGDKDTMTGVVGGALVNAFAGARVLRQTH